MKMSSSKIYVEFLMAAVMLVTSHHVVSAAGAECISFNETNFNISFHPADVLKVLQQTHANLTISVLSHVVPNPPITLRASFAAMETTELLVIGIDDAELNVTSNGTSTIVLDIVGQYVGKSVITFTFYSAVTACNYTVGDEMGVSSTKYNIHGLKILTDLQFAAMIVIICAIAVTVAGFTGLVQMSSVKYYFSHPRIGVQAFVSKFIFIPAISFGLGMAFDLPGPMLFALTAMGACPPGVQGMAFAVAFGNDLDMAIIDSSFSTFLMLVILPLWVSTLGQKIFLVTYEVPLRFFVLLLQVLTAIFLLPGLLMFVLHYYWPRVMRYVATVTRLVGFLSMLAAFVLICYSNYEWFFPCVSSWKMVVPSVLLVIIAPLVGFVTAMVARLPLRVAVQYGAQCGFPNVAYGLFVSNAMFPKPDAERAFVPAFFFVTSSLCLLVLSALVAVVMRIVARRRQQRKSTDYSLSSTSSSQSSAVNPKNMTHISYVDGNYNYLRSAMQMSAGTQRSDYI